MGLDKYVAVAVMLKCRVVAVVLKCRQNWGLLGIKTSWLSGWLLEGFLGIAVTLKR